MTTATEVVRWLRAAGEPSRLRLLALCAESALSVSDLAHALGQSEPRVSRHLRILCEAGLLERLRHGQWVDYRVADGARAVSFVRGLLAQVDRRDPQLQRDRSGARAAAAPAARTTAHGVESRLGRSLAAFLVAGGFGPPLGSVLVIGATHPELLECAAAAARACTALSLSRRAAQGARAFAERRGFACRIVQAASPQGPSPLELARAGAPFDAVLLDHLSVSSVGLARRLEDLQQLLAPGGRLWIFEPYELLEGTRGRVVEHPLARLRRLLGAVGLVCERLSPLDADGEHVLAAVARAAPAGGAQAAHAGPAAL
jgi:DNA-binding transcriptional ArsR family regulator